MIAILTNFPPSRNGVINHQRFSQLATCNVVCALANGILKEICPDHHITGKIIPIILKEVFLLTGVILQDAEVLLRRHIKILIKLSTERETPIIPMDAILEIAAEVIAVKVTTNTMVEIKNAVAIMAVVRTGIVTVKDPEGRDRRSTKESRKSRDRDRSYRDDDRDSNDGRDRSPILSNSSSAFDTGFYKNQPPNNTIMIRGLAQHITENDVRQDIINCGLMPKDIRLIRKKDTGASRGFAFVEFSTLQEAMRWMEMKQGVLMLQDQYRAIMQYSIPKDASQQSEKPPSSKATADWFCIKCGAQNFKRRDNCFKCHASRMESEEGGSGSDEVCTYATKTIMLRNLDALTTEDSVMAVLKDAIPDLISTVSGVCIGRDPLTSTSRGICYLALESTVDALALYGALTSLETPLSIDGKTAIISYCKYHMGDVKKAFSQMQFPTASQPNVYSMNDLNSLADYSASRYAKTAAEYQQYFQYYKMYFAQQINEGASITLNSENQMDSVNAAAALAQNAILQRNSSKAIYDAGCSSTVPLQIPSGSDGKKYPIPDVTKFHYDKNTGYYYDSTTGLYYDRNSQYYYNSVIQKYLYWDTDKLTYLLAPTTSEIVTAAPITAVNTTEISSPPDGKKGKIEKQDRVKVAKKIAKDMERWAKNLNQKKESTRMPIYNEAQGMQSNGTSTASADIGFAVLEKKNTTPATSTQSLNVFSGQKPENVYSAKSQAEGLVAAYGGSSDTSGDEDMADDGTDFLDWEKLVCLLCKRQFFSKDDLTRHKEMSALHKKNMELRYLQKSLESGKKLKYRDRAKERRLKYGESDDPQPSRLKEKYLKAREVPEAPVIVASTSDPIGSENVGNRLLQKMGWTEGQGLGKSNQGRTTIIQAEQRLSTVGLGSKTASYTALPGETYKDCVKKMMFARYQELSEQG
ncbi:uncharacterized protein CBL_13813 [Carabus blaptoides fortunei]